MYAAQQDERFLEHTQQQHILYQQEQQILHQQIQASEAETRMSDSTMSKKTANPGSRWWRLEKSYSSAGEYIDLLHYYKFEFVNFFPAPFSFGPSWNIGVKPKKMEVSETFCNSNIKK